MITTDFDLLCYVSNNRYDAIVVEGYDGVGKGRILSMLSEEFNVIPYRPDYNFWMRHDHRYADRWKVSGFFWDVFSHFFKNYTLSKPLLFDRGVISGSVYAKDESIAKDYKALLRDMKVLHILVVCDKEDYYNLVKVRFPDTDEDDTAEMWEEYLEYTNKFIKSLELAEVEYVVFKNTFDDDLAKTLSHTCEGCGHYSYGFCRHPSMNCKVDKTEDRCLLSQDKEVQDINVTEM